MNYLEILIGILILALPVTAIVTKKKTKEGFKIKDLQPMLIELLIEMQQLVKARNKTYIELENLAVNLLEKRIKEANLTELEVLLVNKEVLRAFIRPHLRKLYREN